MSILQNSLHMARDEIEKEKSNIQSYAFLQFLIKITSSKVFHPIFSAGI